jgi:hypothetical protein
LTYDRIAPRVADLRVYGDWVILVRRRLFLFSRCCLSIVSRRGRTTVVAAVTFFRDRSRGSRAAAGSSACSLWHIESRIYRRKDPSSALVVTVEYLNSNRPFELDSRWLWWMGEYEWRSIEFLLIIFRDIIFWVFVPQKRYTKDSL